MNTKIEEKDDHGKSQAKAQISSIIEMVAALDCNYERIDELIQTPAFERRIEHGDLKPSKKDAVVLAELDALKETAGECNNQEDAENRIHEDPLSVEVRSGWYMPGSEDHKPEEFSILLCWGGPSCRIIGELSEHGQPEKPRLEYQDWFTQWTDYPLTEEEEAALQTYCEQFYFEG